MRQSITMSIMSVVKCVCLSFWIIISACGGATNDSDTSIDEPAAVNDIGAASTSARTSALSNNDTECPFGGILVETGVDVNSNGILENTEVDEAHKVCNGEDGLVGRHGLNALVNVAEEQAGNNCLNGGIRIESGTDINEDNLFDIEELINTVYVCDGSEGLNALVIPLPELAGENCSAGGIRLESGLDVNANDLLDTAEVTEFQYACNGMNGLNALVNTIIEVPGNNCLAGGLRVDVGQDVNNNNLLESEEITMTNFLCHGAAGINGIVDSLTENVGANCSSGGVKLYSGFDINNNSQLDGGEITATNYICHGNSGADGSDGLTGLNALVITSTEVAGVNCQSGGLRIDTGLDNNANNSLDNGEISTTHYICDGSNWWDVLGNTGTLQGYVTLEPGIPAMGATVSIAGSLHYSYTDQFGFYNFPKVSTGHHDISIEAYGSYPQTIKNVAITHGNISTARDVRLNTIREPFHSIVSLDDVPVFNGLNSSDRTGGAVANAGDVNGDGIDDMLVGAYVNNSGAGVTYLFYGKGGLDLSTIFASQADVTFTGIAADDWSGWSVSGAGDVNSDGYADILIGAYQAESFAGQSYLFYGGNALSTSISLSTADVTFTGLAANDLSGFAVSSAGDVNADGFDDILIGAYGADFNGSSSGESYLIYGGASLAASFTLDNADTTFLGQADSDFSGYAVNGGGDVNGDGFDDILIGAYGADPGSKSASGESYLIYGGSGLGSSINLLNADVTFSGKSAGDNSGKSVAMGGDVNGDGFADILIGALFAGSNSGGETSLFYGSESLSGAKSLNNANISFNGISSNDQSATSVSFAGDVNGDGFDEIIIGAQYADPASSASGQSYLIYGAKSSVSSIELSNADVTFNGTDSGQYSGYAVSGAGDVNADGFADVLIGAYGPNNFTGAAYLITGRERYGHSYAQQLTGTHNTSTADAVMLGAAASDLSGRAVSNAGDVNGDGFDDMLIGAYLANPEGGRGAQRKGAGKKKSGHSVVSTRSFSASSNPNTGCRRTSNSANSSSRMSW